MRLSGVVNLGAVFGRRMWSIGRGTLAGRELFLISIRMRNLSLDNDIKPPLQLTHHPTASLFSPAAI